MHQSTKTIYDSINCIKPIRNWQVHNEIHSDMLKRTIWIFKWLQYTTRFLCTAFILLADLTRRTKLLTWLIYTFPVKSGWSQTHQLLSAKMASKRTTMKISKHYLHKSRLSRRNDRTKHCFHQFAQNIASKLKNIATRLCNSNFIKVPLISTRLLLFENRIQKRLILMYRQEIVQKRTTHILQFHRNIIHMLHTQSMRHTTQQCSCTWLTTWHTWQCISNNVFFSTYMLNIKLKLR